MGYIFIKSNIIKKQLIVKDYNGKRMNMKNKLIQGETINNWIEHYPLLNKIISLEEVFWTNPKYEKFEEAIKKVYLSEVDVKEAEERLKRFAPYIAKVFPKTQKNDGIIESPIIKIPNMQRKVEVMFNQDVLGELLLKKIQISILLMMRIQLTYSLDMQLQLID